MRSIDHPQWDPKISMYGAIHSPYRQRIAISVQAVNDRLEIVYTELLIEYELVPAQQLSFEVCFLCPTSDARHMTDRSELKRRAEALEHEAIELELAGRPIAAQGALNQANDVRM